MIRYIYCTFLSILFTAFISGAQTAVELNELGAKKMKANDNTGALAEYNSAVKMIENEVNDYLKKRDEYSKLTTFDKALVEKTPLLEPKPEWVASYYGRGMCEKGMSNKTEALKDFETAIRIDPKFGPPYYERSFLKYPGDDKDNPCMDLRMAMDCGYEKAKNVYEDHFCWNNSIKYFKDASSKYALRDYEGALADLEMAIKINPDSANSYVRRGQCNYALGKFDLAVADYMLAVKKQPNKADAHYNLGLAYESKEEHQKAFDEFTKAVNSNPNYYEAYTHRAAACENLGQFGSAIFDYTNAIRLHPAKGEAYYKRGILKRDNLKNDHDACEDFGKAADLGYSEADELAKECRDPYFKKKKK